MVDFDPTEYVSVIDQVPVDTWADGNETCAQLTALGLASAELVAVRVVPPFFAVKVHLPDVSVVPETSPPAWSVRLPVSHPANVTTAVAGKPAGSGSGCAVWPEPGKAPGVSSSVGVPSSGALDVGSLGVAAGADAVGVAVAEADLEGVRDAVGSEPPSPEEHPAARRLSAPTTANAAIGRDARGMLTGRPVVVDKGPGCVNGNPKVKVEG
ncbi:hypothetical protein [Curtobacterium flaccumfaciens]|uniref:hypothetical protein n=1 Tax=Curtobacterium flaccumfaciens TaxID=2035 RepID=UPI003EE61393